MEEIKKDQNENEQAAPEKENNKPTPEADTDRPASETEANPEDPASVAKAQEEVRKKVREELEKARKIAEEANEALRQGKGRLHLETPIRAQDKDITELPYDFTTMKGHEYTEAMDSDASSNGITSFNLTRRQALALFAKAAEKLTDGVDMQDIIERIGVTDGVEAVEIATLFFTASRRAGRMRISKL